MSNTFQRGTSTSGKLTILALLLSAGIFTIWIFGGLSPGQEADPPAPAETSTARSTGGPGANGDRPDFSGYSDVNDKKQAFIAYMLPRVLAENRRIEALRAELMPLIRAGLAENLSLEDRARLLGLAERYRVALGVDEAINRTVLADLLKQIDVIPPSLALAQAALESAWGTSRFAREANNYFGQWCFQEGCGLVPARRNAGATHEVRAFDSAQESVTAYVLNLNSHPAYAELRDIRFRARSLDQPIDGSALAAGLEDYSARGQDYVDEIRAVIRVNDLGALDGSPAGDP